MSRLVTLMTAQWGDLGFEDLCKLAKQMGYDGLEQMACSHIDLKKAAESQEYCDDLIATMNKYGLVSKAIAAHIVGQCVGDNWDPRLDNFAPSELAGKPEEIRKWAIETMMYAPRAAKNMGIDVVSCTRCIHHGFNSPFTNFFRFAC